MPALALIVGALVIISLAIATKASAQEQDTVTHENVPTPDTPLPSAPITNNPNTWPTGDKLWDVARAIARAEGYNVATSNPYRLNNPGDISDGAHLYNAEQHSGSNVTHFPDAATGWAWLYNKLRNIRDGRSVVFGAAWTWTEFAQKYAGDWQNWLANVTNALDVDPQSTFAEYVNG